MNIPHPPVGYLINRISRLSQRWLDVRLKQFGITGATVPVLAILKSGEALTQKELAEQIGTEQPTMAQLLNRMERDGLITRMANPGDGRSSHVLLTERAVRSLPGARKVMEGGQALVTASFSTRELATLTRLLERYLASVETHLK
ncbi:MAG: MarR family transcriptional regulator [Acidobacteriaceae bacterium]